MGLENSYLKEIDLVNLLKKFYNLTVDRVIRLSQGSANCYKIYVTGQCYVLKELQSEIMLTQVLREIKVCRHLVERGYIVPVHVKTIYGEYYFSVKSHICYLYKWIEGELCEKYTGSLVELESMARHYARLLIEMEGITIQVPNSTIVDCSCAEIQKCVRRHDSILKLVQNERICNLMMNKIDRLNYYIETSQYNFGGMTWKISHGDYNNQQLLKRDNKELATLDFLSIKKMPIAFELFRAYIFYAPDFKRGELDFYQLSKYIKAFSNIIPLNDKDIINMIPLYYMRILKSSFGYEQYALNMNNKIYLELGNELFQQMIFLENYLDKSDELLNRVN